MEYRRLGKSGLNVSVIGLGTWQFSEAWGVLDYELAKTIINKAFESGINFIDTAAVYGRGRSEEFIGRAVKELGIRDDVIIATKLPGDFMNRDDVFRGTEKCIKRLMVDSIDLMQVHWPPLWHNYPTCEYMRALERLVLLGKIKYIGLSDFPVELIESARSCLSRVDIVSIQSRYNLIERDAEKELIPYAEKEGLSFIAWSPLAKGALTGKYSSASPPVFQDVRSGDPIFHINNLRQIDPLIEFLKKTGNKYGKKPAQIALRWLVQYSSTIIPIPGAKTPDQAYENAEAGKFSLSYDDWRTLDEMSRKIRIIRAIW